MTGRASDSTAVIRTVELDAAPAVVWDALTQGAHLSAWFGAGVEIDPFPGGQLVVRDGGRRRRAVIVDFEPGRRLGLRWLPDHRPVGFIWPADDTPPGTSGEVTFELEPTLAGTRLTVTEIPPATIAAGAEVVRA